MPGTAEKAVKTSLNRKPANEQAPPPSSFVTQRHNYFPQKSSCGGSNFFGPKNKKSQNLQRGSGIPFFIHLVCCLRPLSSEFRESWLIKEEVSDFRSFSSGLQWRDRGGIAPPSFSPSPNMLSCQERHLLTEDYS